MGLRRRNGPSSGAVAPVPNSRQTPTAPPPPSNAAWPSNGHGLPVHIKPEEPTSLPSRAQPGDDTQSEKSRLLLPHRSGSITPPSPTTSHSPNPSVSSEPPPTGHAHAAQPAPGSRSTPPPQGPAGQRGVATAAPGYVPPKASSPVRKTSATSPRLHSTAAAAASLLQFDSVDLPMGSNEGLLGTGGVVGEEGGGTGGRISTSFPAVQHTSEPRTSLPPLLQEQHLLDDFSSSAKQ